MKSFYALGLVLTLCPLVIEGSSPIRIALTKATLSGTTSLLRSSSIELDNATTTIFYGKMTVGTPAQSFNFAFDTTKSIAWIPGEDCSNCGDLVNEFNSTASSTFEQADVDYSGTFNVFGTVAYTLGSDTFVVGSLTDSNQTFGLATSIESIQSGIDGFAGLGPGNYSLIEQILSQNNLSNVFSLYIDPASSGANGGEILLGSSTSDDYSIADLVTVTSADENEWLIEIQNITVGDNTSITCSSPCNTQISILGSPNITGPEDTIQAIYTAIQANTTGFVNQTDDLPSITFTIGDSNFTLTSDDYLLTCVNETCSTKFYSSSTTSQLCLGTVFVSKYFWVFNLTSNEIGIAPFNGSSNVQSGLFIVIASIWAWLYLDRTGTS